MAWGEVSSQEGAVLSSQGAAASCLEGAFPLERHDPDQEAFPLVDPSAAACQEAGPSYLEGARLGPLGAELLVQAGTVWALRRCWHPLLLQQPFLCPAGSSPAGKARLLL